MDPRDDLEAREERPVVEPIGKGRSERVVNQLEVVGMEAVVTRVCMAAVSGGGERAKSEEEPGGPD